ncbi:MAG: hypothetical protein K1X88_16770 [Nannocystaceae bacterium]|nr:hypothetical protein [Nannocystaceae bacterium]
MRPTPLAVITALAVSTAIAAPAHARAPAPETTPPATVAPTATEPASETPTPASAPVVLGDDEVELRGGGFVRGRIIELLPNTRVVILLDGTGERREIPWDDVADVRRGGTPPTEPPARPAVTPEPSTPVLGRPRVHLSLLRDRPVTLYEVQGEIVASGYYSSMYGMNFRSVCAAPCDRPIDGTRAQEFFLATGEGAMWTASRKFTLADRQGDVTLEVRPGSKGLRIVGAVLLGIGIGCAIGGAILAIPKSTRIPGLALLGVGAVGLAGGIPTMIIGRTRWRYADREPTTE